MDSWSAAIWGKDHRGRHDGATMAQRWRNEDARGPRLRKRRFGRSRMARSFYVGFGRDFPAM